MVIPIMNADAPPGTIAGYEYTLVLLGVHDLATKKPIAIAVSGDLCTMAYRRGPGWVKFFMEPREMAEYARAVSLPEETMAKIIDWATSGQAFVVDTIRGLVRQNCSADGGWRTSV